MLFAASETSQNEFLRVFFQLIEEPQIAWSKLGAVGGMNKDLTIFFLFMKSAGNLDICRMHIILVKTPAILGHHLQQR